MPLRVCIINPRYEPSFWGYQYALPILDPTKRCWTAPGPLPLLAALAPPGFTVELIDENVEAIDFEYLRRFDIIGVTGMIVQRGRMNEILAALAGLPAIVVLGGPYVSVAESEFDGLCDVRFIGEADETWPAFLQTVAAGEKPQERYEQLERTDMAQVPVARYDLLKVQQYTVAAVQFSRGCPFQCEFCDIITIFGRRPRVKGVEQFLAELEAIRLAGFRFAFLVDDNFIGNKAAAKKLLLAMIEWQQERGFPLRLSTEASINLADDAEFIDLMVRAGIGQVFVGVESPRADSLRETKKFQNVAGDGLLEKLARIRDGGLVVNCGMIVGFDSDDAAIFDDQFVFLEEAAIAQANVAILAPVPTTPLFDRLKAEGRLDDSDPEVKFIPKLMTQRQLREGHTALLARLFDPETFLRRLLRGYRQSASFRRVRRERGGRTVISMVGALPVAARFVRELARRSLLPLLAPYLRVYVRENLTLGRSRLTFAEYVQLCALSFHYYMIARSDQKTDFGNVRPQAVAQPNPLRPNSSPL